MKCNVLSKSSKWEMGFVHYIARFTISRFIISRFEYILCIWRLSTSHPNCPYHKLLHKIRFFLSPLVWHAAGGREETIYCFAFYQIFGGMYLLTYPPTLKNPSLLSPLKNIISSKKVCYFCNSLLCWRQNGRKEATSEAMGGQQMILTDKLDLLHVEKVHLAQERCNKS